MSNDHITATGRNQTEHPNQPSEQLIERYCHLAAFYDAADLLPSVDWESALVDAAATSGLLVVRTDLYASRDWCQREVLVAKRADMPMVVLQALHRGEERGSFLMDHLPAVPLHGETVDAQHVSRTLNHLCASSTKRRGSTFDHFTMRSTAMDNDSPLESRH